MTTITNLQIFFASTEHRKPGPGSENPLHGDEVKESPVRRRGLRPVRHTVIEPGKPHIGANGDGERRRVRLRIRLLRGRHRLREFRR